MDTQVLYTDLIQRKQTLERVKTALKERFLDLDDIIHPPPKFPPPKTRRCSSRFIVTGVL